MTIPPPPFRDLDDAIDRFRRAAQRAVDHTKTSTRPWGLRLTVEQADGLVLLLESAVRREDELTKEVVRLQDVTAETEEVT
jgi:hypothetical protein